MAPASEMASQEHFLAELAARRQLVDDFLMQPRYRDWFGPEHLRRAVYSYVERAGKRLRPAVLLFACGAAGGEEDDVLPAAAAIEMFHTWTLVHDDLIDNDHLRRGQATVHHEAAAWARDEFLYDDAAAREYGRDICVLAGDIQQAWSVCMFLECAANPRIGAAVVLKLVSMLESQVVNELIQGETLDLQFSRRPFSTLSEDAIVSMLRLKTGVLYGFAALAGACLGSGRMPGETKAGAHLAEFASKCGIAFQLQDDILGIIGDETSLGKPVGSDLREGKRTTIVFHALANATDAQSRFLLHVLGNRDAASTDIDEAKQLLIQLGGIEHTRALARECLETAVPVLDVLPASSHKSLLLGWADHMLNRTF